MSPELHFMPDNADKGWVSALVAPRRIFAKIKWHKWRKGRLCRLAYTAVP